MMRSLLTAAALLVVPVGVAARTSSIMPKLEQLAAAGNAEALYHLGMMYQTGSNVPVDHHRALIYFRRSAKLGDPLAAYKLGCFDAGQDDILPVNEDKALAEKLVAARAGYALAQQDVAAIYAGRGDGAAAEEWIRQAAGQGIADALFGYASLRNGKNGLPRDGAIMVAYFTLFLATQDASSEQQAWLKEQRDALSPDDGARADQILATFAPKPTALTIKALSGQRAAEQLTQSAR